MKRVGFAVALLCVWAGVAAAQRARADGAASVLAQAKTAMGFARVGSRVIHARGAEGNEENYQSDRSYPPFFSTMKALERWFDPQSGVAREKTLNTFPGGGAPMPRVVISDAKRVFEEMKGQLKLSSRWTMQPRYLDPWAVIAEWAAAGDARYVGQHPYRDYPRAVLERATAEGTQQLYLDPKTGFPVKLDFLEKHYLWGQRQVEYVYSNWFVTGGVATAGSSFRLADGKTEITRTIGSIEIVARTAAPSLALPAAPAQSTDLWPAWLHGVEPTAVQVGPKTYLLVNPGYTEAVTQVGDELFVFDATQSEERARRDAAIIAKLFPGAHKITVVVSDLAWPHIAGVRYWVANGATIMAHKATRAFLQEIVDRRWTLAPDLMEQRRATAKLTFVGIDGAHRAAGGAVTLHPIDGIGSEAAIVAYVAADRFLWASDYIQTTAQPTAYTSEVWAAVQRDGLRPERTAAQHLPLTKWSVIDALQKRAGAAAGSSR